MSTPVNYNGTVFNVPAYQDTGYAQGAGNLSSYLIALATGSLTLSGGSFPLTADVDFGASFGLKAAYYKSRSATISSTGILRLARTEFIAWRDQGDANDLELAVNASDQLTYNGSVIASSGGALIGTTLTLSATSNQMIVGTTRTVTFNLPTPASTSRIVTFPDLSGDYSVVGTIAAQTIAGVKTFSSGVVINPTTNQLVLGVTNTTTISATAPASSSVYTIPDVGTTGNFILSAGAQTITGAKTFANQTLLLQETGGTDVATINVAALGAGRAYTVIDAGASASFVMTAGTQTITGAITLGNAVTAISGALEQTGNIFFKDNANSDIRSADQTVTLAVRNAGIAMVGTATITGDFYTTAYTNYFGSSTVTGWGSFSTSNIYYKKVGKTISCAFFIQGTSNATTVTFTLPHATTILFDSSARVIDNGASIATPGLIEMNGSTVSVFKDMAGTAFTNTGTKAVSGTFVYETP